MTTAIHLLAVAWLLIVWELLWLKPWKVHRMIGLEEMLLRDHARMRKAGGALAEAAVRVIHDYDGLHRLSLAVAGWAEAIAAEGDRPHPASVGRNPKGEDREDGLRAEHEHAVGATSAETPNNSRTTP